jgi:hypothetical protein
MSREASERNLREFLRTIATEDFRLGGGLLAIKMEFSPVSAFWREEPLRIRMVYQVKGERGGFSSGREERDLQQSMLEVHHRFQNNGSDF